jgi:hypothetical protein
MSVRPQVLRADDNALKYDGESDKGPARRRSLVRTAAPTPRALRVRGADRSAPAGTRVGPLVDYRLA